MLQGGLIQYNNKPFNSPMLLVKKNDGSWHLCVNYQNLNQVTIK